MLRWIPYAFVRIVICFITGILSAVYMGEYLPVFWARILCLALTGTYLLLYFLLKRRFFSLHYILGTVGFCSIFFLGYLNTIENNESLNIQHFIHEQGEVHYYTAKVLKPGEERARSIRYEAALEHYNVDQHWPVGVGKILLYTDKQTKLSFGDRILIKGAPQTIDPPKNPGEFDYKRFLSFKNIYHQHFLRNGNYTIIDHPGINPVIEKAYQARKWAASRLKQYIKSEREQAIALALILGVKDGLDNEIQQAYAASGAMHVLAVSGLHVGIIYLIILFFLGRWENTVKGRWLLAICSITLLWGYAMITGFSPSVLRAVTMFSFIALAKAANRHTNIYNTLAASAFILLLFDPYLIMSVGFQLSFLAVLGIVYVQPRLYNLYVPDSIVLDKIWGITTVALAAQLATFALGIFYFNQFPSLFFLSNLVVVPGAFLILLGGLFIIAFSFIDLVANIIGQLLEWVIYAINEIIFALEKIPYARIDGIHISVFETWLIIGIVVSVLLFFEMKNIRMIYFSLSLSVIFSVFRISTITAGADKKIIIYSIPNHTAVGFMANGQASMYADSALIYDKDNFNYHLKPYHLVSHVRKFKWLTNMNKIFKTKYGLKFFEWYGKKLLVLDDKIEPDIHMTRQAQINYILIGKGFNKDLSWITNNFHFELLILDGSLSKYRVNYLRSEADTLGLTYCSVYDEGARQLLIKD